MTTTTTTTTMLLLPLLLLQLLLLLALMMMMMMMMMMVGIGGRWHSSVPPLLRRLAREYVARTPALAGSASLVTARWTARLSAALLRGNSAVVLAARPAFVSVAPRAGAFLGAGLPHLLPDGDSAYELLIR